MKFPDNVPHRWIALSLLAVAACNSSNGDGDSSPPPPGEITLDPSTAPAASMVKVDGLELDACPLRTSEIRVAGQTAPTVLNARHEALMRLPLFYDEGTQWAAPPAGPQDVEIFCNGSLWATLPRAITITELPPAPGTTEAIVADYRQIAADYKSLAESLAPTPGIQQQLFTAIFAALEEILSGTNENSLPVLLANLNQTEPDVLALMDAMYAIGDIDETTATFRERMQQWRGEAEASVSASSTLPVVPPQSGPPGSAPLGFAPKDNVLILKPPVVMSDTALSVAMYLYDDIREFSEGFIADTASQFSTVAGAISIFIKSKHLAAANAVLFFLDYVMNKLVVSALPATLNTIDFRIETNQLANSEVTASDFKLHARNIPALLTITDITSVILNTIGVAGSQRFPGDEAVSWLNALEEALPATVKYGLETLDREFKQYADSIPGGFAYDLEAFAIVPLMRFEAVAETRELYKMYPDHTNVVSPLPAQLEWQASETAWGSAEVFITPAGRSFGANNTNVPSNKVLVYVGELAIVLDVYTLDVPENETASVGVKLSHAPKDGTFVSVSAQRFTGDSDISIVTELPLFFDSANWDEFQELVLAAADDEDDEDGEATISIWTVVDDYAIEPITIEATVIAIEADDDRPRFVTNVTQVTVPEAETATFQVKLSQPPLAPLTAIVTRVSGDSDIIVESPVIMKFNEDNFDANQTVTLYASRDDDAEEGKTHFRISANPPANVDEAYVIAREGESGDALVYSWTIDYGDTQYTAGGTIPITLDPTADPETVLGTATGTATRTEGPDVRTGTSTLTVRNYWADTICYCGTPITEYCLTNGDPENLYMLAVDTQLNISTAPAKQKQEGRRDIVVIVGEDAPFSYTYTCGGFATGTISAELR